MITDDKKISKEIEKQLNLCSCKEKYPVEEVRPGRCYRLWIASGLAVSKEKCQTGKSRQIEQQHFLRPVNQDS
ncbi:hypothetical protein D917_10601 [Trichinella nativa]|uniref:Uncharacterized protein n=1 Tax=Trichinella nativa TaxID=6335 RepID=A0A1Y3EE64_9BILA|nr:hypothetical protein D917_10601 [Trichinella nativa]